MLENLLIVIATAIVSVVINVAISYFTLIRRVDRNDHLLEQYSSSQEKIIQQLDVLQKIVIETAVVKSELKAMEEAITKIEYTLDRLKK
jgi:Na+/H+ antiporter NhaB